MPEYLAPGVYVEEVPSAVKPIAGVGTSTAGFVGVSADISGGWDAGTKSGMPARPTGGAYLQAAALSPRPVGSWTEFTQSFGDIQEVNQYLAHAVYGFFNNGGSRCWVTRVAPDAEGKSLPDKAYTDALAAFTAIDEIAIVAIPGAVSDAVQNAVLDHCENEFLRDRFAILDGRVTTTLTSLPGGGVTVLDAPLTGRNGQGWPFGRKPRESDIHRLIGTVAGVDYATSLKTTLHADERPLDCEGDTVECIERTGRFLIYSGRHSVTTA